jgi:hypothetical protein
VGFSDLAQRSSIVDKALCDLPLPSCGMRGIACRVAMRIGRPNLGIRLVVWQHSATTSPDFLLTPSLGGI